MHSSLPFWYCENGVWLSRDYGLFAIVDGKINGLNACV